MWLDKSRARNNQEVGRRHGTLRRHAHHRRPSRCRQGRLWQTATPFGRTVGRAGQQPKRDGIDGSGIAGIAGRQARMADANMTLRFQLN